jgi:aspartyl-tRNA(Asn)/glutamyl-tRNA(Gln) amidotransferase subunit A
MTYFSSLEEAYGYAVGCAPLNTSSTARLLIGPYAVFQKENELSDLHLVSATKLAEMIRAREVSVEQIAQSTLSRIDEINPKLNALIYVDRQQILHDAKELDAAVQRGGPLGLIHGVPYTIKDNTSMKGLPFTSGFKPNHGNIGAYDAEVYKRLQAAGGLFIGKTNLPEFGYYGGCEGHEYGAAHNPFKQGYSTGGSSGGAAASVAAGITPLAEGNDGAGSVRIPSSLCGTVGLKPTAGVVPETLFPNRYHSFLFHGPITRTVADSALMMDVWSGPSDADPKTIEKPVPSFVEAIKGNIKGLRLAWTDDLGTGVHVDPEVLAICRDVLGDLSKLGVIVTEAAPKWDGDISKAMWNGLWIPAFAEVYDLHDWAALDGEVDDYLIEIMRAAETTTAVDVARGSIVRGRMWDIFTAFMKDYDVLASPTLTSATFPHGEFAPKWLHGKSVREQILDWLLTYPYNMLSNPALTIPAGFTSDSRPVGIQFAARPRQDALLLRLARNLEEVRPWANAYRTI